MKISISILLEKISFKKEMQFILNGPQTPYLSLPVIYSALDYMHDITKLYICPASELDQMIFLPENISFVCIEMPLHWKEYQDQNINMLVINKKEALSSVFNEIQNSFFYYNNWEKELTQLILARRPLQELIDVTDKVVGWPLSIIDIAQGTLAISRFYDSDDIIWQEQLKGYISTQTLDADNVRGSQIQSSCEPVQLYSIASNRILLSQAIRIKGKVVGYVGAHRPRSDNEHFSKGVEQLINTFTHYVVKYMSSVDFYANTNGDSFEHILINILEGKLIDESIICERAQYLKFNLNGTKMMISLELPETRDDAHDISKFQKQVTNIFPKFICIAYYGKLVLFGSNLKTNPLPDNLEAWAAERQILVGISIPFTKVAQIPDRYIQSEKAIYLGKALDKNHSVHFYEDYISMHACELLTQQVKDPLIYIHPLIEKLRLLEIDKKIPLCKTLNVYLQCEHNLGKAAELLYLHRNTLQYRINMIQEYLQNDLKDSDLCKELLFSFTILDYLKTFQHYGSLYDDSDFS